MTPAEIEDVIVSALAAQAGCDPREMRRRLEQGGPELPVDSLLAAEVLAEVEERCGARLPATAENARNLTSVATFARAVQRVVEEAASAAESA